MSRRPPPSQARQGSFRLFDLLCRLALPVLRLTGRPRPGPALDPPRHILVLKPDHLGDLILATPALDALHERHPSARITVVAKSWTAPILRLHPAVSAVVPLNLPWCCHPLETALSWGGVLAAADDLAREDVDVALSLQDHAFTHLFGLLCRAPRRVGFAPHGGAPLLTDPLSPPSEDEHAAASHQRVAAVLGATQDDRPSHVELSPDETIEGRRRASEALGADGPYVAFHVGAASASKSLPIEDAAAVYADLHARRPDRVLALAGPREGGRVLALAAELGRDLPHLVLDDVRSLAAVLAGADLAVTHDSGAGHVAAAVGTAVVVLFVGGNPTRWAPRGETVNVVRCEDPAWREQLRGALP